MANDQHSRIIGHTEIEEINILTINKIKSIGQELGHTIDDIGSRKDVDQEAVNHARQYLQTCLMWACRAVAKPEGF